MFGLKVDGHINNYNCTLLFKCFLKSTCNSVFVLDSLLVSFFSIDTVSETIFH